MLVLLLVRVWESHFVFFPNYPGRLEGDWNSRGLAPQEVWIITSDSTKLHAWWVPHEQAKFTFLVFHGHAGNIADRAPLYEFLRDTPANALAVEYRGYGRSEGSPSESGVYKDAVGAYEYLVSVKSIPPRAIVSFGQSAGGTIPIGIAGRFKNISISQIPVVRYARFIRPLGHQAEPNLRH